MELNLLARSLMAALAHKQMRRATPQRLSAEGPSPSPSIPFNFLSSEEQLKRAERDAWNAKVSTRQVKRRIARPWKQRATV